MKDTSNILRELLSLSGNGFELSSDNIAGLMREISPDGVVPAFSGSVRDEMKNEKFPGITVNCATLHGGNSSGTASLSINLSKDSNRGKKTSRGIEILFLINLDGKSDSGVAARGGDTLSTRCGTVKLIGKPCNFYYISDGETVGEYASRIFTESGRFEPFAEELNRPDSKESVSHMNDRDSRYGLRGLYRIDGDNYATLYVWVNGMLSSIGKKLGLEDVCSLYSYMWDGPAAPGSRYPGLVGEYSGRDFSEAETEELYERLLKEAGRCSREKRRVFDMSDRYAREMDRLKKIIYDFAEEKSRESGIRFGDLGLHMDGYTGKPAPDYYINNKINRK